LKRIAVVEDNADNMLLVRVLLEEHYRITEFSDGVTAMKEMRQYPPDLVLLDISLPEMDGLEVLAHMREDDVLSALPVIALTAHAGVGDRAKFLAAGFNDYVTKPIVDEALFLAAIAGQLRDAAAR
jgi:two-component system cell cycle response regulator DivK